MKDPDLEIEPSSGNVFLDLGFPPHEAAVLLLRCELAARAAPSPLRDTIRPMLIRLLAFASAADALGAGELDWELPAGASVGDLRTTLEARFPGLGPLWPRLAVAVNGEIVGAGAVVPEDAEVALLPPVSGGTAAPRATLTDGPIDAAALAALTSLVASPERGANVLFLGTSRNHHQGRPVSHLTYDAYRSMAQARLATLVAELEAATPGLAVAIVHRLGDVPAGEASVAIATAAPHRAAAYEASREALERLKREVPIWKREHYTDGGARWREEEPLSAPAPAAPPRP